MKKNFLALTVILLFIVMSLVTCTLEYIYVSFRPPEEIQITSFSSNGVIISWSTVKYADGYRVYRSTSSSGTYIQIGTPATNSFTNTGLSTDTTYYYQITAYNKSVESNRSSYVTATILYTPPAGVTATANSSNSITVNWNSVAGATGYRVYRSTSSSGTYTQVGTPTYAGFTDTGLIADTTYYYRVSAHNDFGQTAQSGYVSAATLSPPPTGVNATANSSNSITVNWNSVAGATGYRVYRSTSLSGTYTLIASPATNSFTDTGLINSTQYFYRVSYINNDGKESDRSSAVSANTDEALPFNYADGVANIGRIGPGGGRVYYYNPSGFTVEGYSGSSGSFSTYTAYYLEAAPENASNSSVIWGDYGTLISGITTFTSTGDANASKIGNGRRDTQIIAVHMSGKLITQTAAQVCAAYRGPNNLTDWFLPSLGELYLYYQSSVPGKPTSGWFWSSSQSDSNIAWYVSFDDGSRYNYGKGNYGNLVVRAVRAF